MAGEIAVDPLGVGLTQTQTVWAQVARVRFGVAAQSHLAHENVDDEGLLGAFQTFAEPSLTNQPDEHHLHHPVVGMGEAEPAGESHVILRPQLQDTLAGACDAERSLPDSNVSALAGDAHGAPRESESVQNSRASRVS